MKALVAAARDPKNLKAVREEASILLVLASEKNLIAASAARLGLSQSRMEATKIKFKRQGLASIIRQRREASPREWEEYRRQIEGVIENDPTRRLRWTPMDIAKQLGLTTDVVRERCIHLGIDLQAVCDRTMKAKIEAVLKSDPPNLRWTHPEIAEIIKISPTSLFYWLRKLKLEVPPEKSDRRDQVAAIIAEINNPYWTYTEVGLKLGVSSRSAIDICNKYGFVAVPRDNNQAIADAISKAPGPWTYRSIAVECDVHAATVTTYCKAHGLKPPSATAARQAMLRRLIASPPPAPHTAWTRKLLSEATGINVFTITHYCRVYKIPV